MRGTEGPVISNCWLLSVRVSSVNGASPEFVTLRVCVDDVLPTTTVLKFKLVAERESEPFGGGAVEMALAQPIRKKGIPKPRIATRMAEKKEL